MNKEIEKIVLYKFEEPVIGGKNGETREIHQACVIYKDKSFENILVDNSEWDDVTRGAYGAEYDKYITELLATRYPEYRKIKGAVEELKEDLLKKQEQGIMDEENLSHFGDLYKKYEQLENRAFKELNQSGKLSYITGEKLENNFEKYCTFAKTKQVPAVIQEPFAQNSNTTTKTKPKKEKLHQRIKNFFTPKIDAIGKFLNGDKDWKLNKKSKTGKIKEKKKGKIQKAWTFLLKHPKTTAIVTTFGLLWIGRNIDRFNREHSTKTGVITECSDFNNDDKIKSQEEQVQEVDYSNMSIDELIEVTTHDKARQAQDSIWGYLNYCNDTLAEKLLEKGKTSRFMILYKEALSSYIAYNADSLYQDDINHIAGNSSLKATTLNNAFDKGAKEETLAYVASKKPIDKNALFITDEGKEFNEKYAKLVANMASAKEMTAKKEATSSFRKALKKEIKEMKIEKGKTDRIASYKASIIPIVDAAEFICKRDHMDPILTEKEKETFNDLLLREQVRVDFEEFTRDLKDYQMTSRYAEDNFDITIMEKDPDLDDFILAAEADLTARGIYNEDDRNISDHSAFESAKEDKKKSENSSKTKEERAVKKEKKSVEKAAKVETETDNKEDSATIEAAKQEATNEQEAMQQQEEEKKEDLEDQIDKENNVDSSLNGADINDENKDENGNISSSVEAPTLNGENSDNGPLVNPEDYEQEEGTTTIEPPELEEDTGVEEEYVDPENAPNIIEGEIPIEELADQIISYLEQNSIQTEKTLTKRI